MGDDDAPKAKICCRAPREETASQIRDGLDLVHDRMGSIKGEGALSISRTPMSTDIVGPKEECAQGNDPAFCTQKPMFASSSRRTTKEATTRGGRNHRENRGGRRLGGED